MYSITISSMSRTEAGDGGIESPNPNIMPRTTRPWVKYHSSQSTKKATTETPDVQ